MGAPAPKKELLIKCCAVCGKEFENRKASVACCSLSCARVLDAKRHGPSNWKGGVNRHSSGYLKELRKGHPRADSKGYVLQHRLVMEEGLGRKLEAHERVHHRNGIRDDNRLENLELWVVRGQSSKDPSGQRAVDLARHMLDSLSEADRAELIKNLGAQ